MMDTLIEGDKVTYLYSLADGAAKKSHAAIVAQLLEIPQLSLVEGMKVWIISESVLGAAMKT